MGLKETVANIWTMYTADRLCDIVIPTNGTIKKNGAAVMGAGLAADAVRKFLTIDFELGEKLKRFGNHVHYFEKYRMITFPVKFEWQQRADLALIQQSARELQQLMNNKELSHVLVPHVGCGNGGLLWRDVRAVLSVELVDSRCEFIRYNKEV